MSKNNQIKIVKPGVILLGFIALAAQIILLREFLTLFSGNELVIGIILANWMLLTGLGAYLGRFFKNKITIVFWLILFLGTLAFLPSITVVALHYIWHLLFLPGVMAGILHVFFYSLIILSPFCILSGILFTLFSKEKSTQAQENKISNVYAWESLGSLMGGIVFNFILIWVTTTFQSLFIILIVSVITIFYLGIKSDQHLLSAIIIILSFIFGYLFMSYDFDKKVREKAFPSQEIIYTNDSPYGIFTITQQHDQQNYYENNILMASSGDIIKKEESVHLAMVQHKEPKNVLVLSGIISGVIEEIMEYPVTRIDYVDINPEIFKIARQTLKDHSYQILNLYENDPIRFLKRNSKMYDVVLINLPKPSTIQLNRYYTQEFFHLLKQNLNCNAVISISMPSSGNYLSEESRNLLSIIFKTLRTEFNSVIIFPADKDFLIASDNQLSYKIAERVEILNISTDYVNTYYFDDAQVEMRSKQLLQQLDYSVVINHDFSPVFYQSQLKLWMSHFNIKYWIPAFIIIIISGLFFIKAGPIYKGVYAAGFTGTAIEIVLLLVFQVVFGYVYAVIGVFIMIFMGGLAFGAYYISKFLKEINA
ncbi:MAG: hypothetical protein C0597_04490, partial [Marinilabiliales bacterium]